MLYCRRLNSSNSAHGTFIIIGTLFNLFIPVIPTLHSNSPCSLISNSFLLLNDYILSAYVPTKCSLSFWEHDFEFLYVRYCASKCAIAFLAHFYPSLHLLKIYTCCSYITTNPLFPIAANDSRMCIYHTSSIHSRWWMSGCLQVSVTINNAAMWGIPI